MEKSVNFATIKEKIIKTDEVIKLYSNTLNQKNKLSCLYKELKARFEQTSTEVTALKADKKRLIFNSMNVKSSHDTLAQEHSTLKLENATILAKYDKLMVEYHTSLQTMQTELETSKQEYNAVMKSKQRASESKKVLELTAQCKSLKNDVAGKDKEIARLVLDNEKVVKGLNELKSKHKSLKAELVKVKRCEDRKKRREEEVEDLEKSFDSLPDIGHYEEMDVGLTSSDIENKIGETGKLDDENCLAKVDDEITIAEKLIPVEIEQTPNCDKLQVRELEEKCAKLSLKLTEKIQQIVALEEARCTLKLENQQLSSLNEELSKKRNDSIGNDSDCKSGSSTSSNLVKDYLDEMIFRPSILRPLSPSLSLNLMEDDSMDIPQITITPPTPDKKSEQVFKPTVKQIPARPKKKFIYNPIITRKKIVRKPKRAKRARDSILDAILTLKKSNINFTISSDNPCNDYVLPSSYFDKYAMLPAIESSACIKEPRRSHFTEKLACFSKLWANDSFMLLNQNSENKTELLGFFDVKSESASPSASRLDVANPDTIFKSLANIYNDKQPSRNDFELENIFDTNYSKQSKEREFKWNGLVSPTPSLISNNDFSPVKKLAATPRRVSNRMKRKSSRWPSTSFVNVEEDKRAKEELNLKLKQERINFESESRRQKSISESSMKLKSGKLLPSPQPVVRKERRKTCTSESSNPQIEAVPLLLSPLRSVKGSPSKVVQELTPPSKKRAKMSLNAIFKKNAIQIVQNILITPQSEEGEKNNSEANSNNLMKIQCDNNINLNMDKIEKKSVLEMKIESYPEPPKKQRVAHTPNEVSVLDKILQPKPVVKSVFKPPVVRKVEEELKSVDILSIIPDMESPASPTPEDNDEELEQPVIIPVSKEKMSINQIKQLFEKLLTYSNEEKAVEDVVFELVSEDVHYIAECIVLRISQDFIDKADTQYPGPVLTPTQRVFLGLMVSLEKSNRKGVLDSFLQKAETYLYKPAKLAEIAPLTRLYMAICKLRKDMDRARRFCCQAFYFMGTLAIPLFFTVLTSWIEVLPKADTEKHLMAKVLVHLVQLHPCVLPGSNFVPLLNLLKKYYHYPCEAVQSESLFHEIYYAYLKNPNKLSDFTILLFCKNSPAKFVYRMIEEKIKPFIKDIPNENFKATVIILIGNICSQFNRQSDAPLIEKIKEWLISLEDDASDLIKRSIYLSIGKLPRIKNRDN